MVRSVQLSAVALGGLVALAAGLVYLPGLPGGFAFDDYHTIVNNPALLLSRIDLATLLDAALSTDTGPLKRPLAMLTFAVNRSCCGLDPLSFKLVNIAIHALNAVLVFVLLRLIVPLLATRAASHQRIAAVAAILWAVHPIQLTSVLYIVQRMTALHATFMLAALIAYATARRRELDGRPVSAFRYLLVLAAGALALLVKETAVLLPLYILTLEACVFRFRQRARLRTGFLLAAAVLAAMALLTISLAPGAFGTYGGRDFTLSERLLTESRVVVTYLRLLVLPDLSVFGMFHDDIELSRGWLTPLSTPGALLIMTGMVAACWWRSRPAIAFGCAWFLLGHTLESTVAPLELMHEHRNYLPAIGPLLALTIVGEAGLRATRWSSLRGLVAGSVIALFAVITVIRATTWSDVSTLAEFEVAHHPHSSRAQYEVGRVRIEQATANGNTALRAAGIAALERAHALAPTVPLPITALINTAVLPEEAPRLEAVLAGLETLPAQTRADVLKGVVFCQGYAKCPAQPALVSRLAGTLLGASDIGPAARQLAIEWLAVYYLRVLGDAPAAIGMLEGIVAEAPRNVALRARLVEALFAAKRLPEARLQGAALLDVLPWHSPWSARARWRRLSAIATTD